MWQEVGYSRLQLLFYLFTKGTDDGQLVRSPDGDGDGYEADDEASPFPSPADTNTNDDELDDSEHGDIGQFTLSKFGNFLFEILLFQFYSHIIVMLLLRLLESLQHSFCLF